MAEFMTAIPYKLPNVSLPPMATPFFAPRIGGSVGQFHHATWVWQNTVQSRQPWRHRCCWQPMVKYLRRHNHESLPHQSLLLAGRWSKPPPPLCSLRCRSWAAAAGNFFGRVRGVVRRSVRHARSPPNVPATEPAPDFSDDAVARANQNATPVFFPPIAFPHEPASAHFGDIFRCKE